MECGRGTLAQGIGEHRKGGGGKRIKERKQQSREATGSGENFVLGITDENRHTAVREHLKQEGG